MRMKWPDDPCEVCREGAYCDHPDTCCTLCRWMKGHEPDCAECPIAYEGWTKGDTYDGR